ncbi:MAG TPA: ABC transporter substrate-binding protein [Candidatus Binatia bacterium]|nr:ABC transporter substrate-binding protein [Candidatus Binatia bacterium]
MRRAALLAAAALLSALLPAAAGAADPFEINVILPLTGQATFVGKGSQQGLAGVEEATNKSGGVNGRPIHFVFQDDQSNPQITVQIANALIAKKVSVILGTAGVAGCSAVLPLVSSGPVLYCLSPGLHPPEGSYAFSASVSTADTTGVSIRYFRERGWKRIAIITSTDASGQDGERGMDAALALAENKDMAVVDREHFAPGDVTVSAQMSRMKAANPQAILAWMTGTPAGTVFRTITELGIDLPILVTNSNSTYAQMQQYAQFLPKQLYFPDQPSLAPDQVTDQGVKDALKTYFTTLNGMGIKPDVIPSTTWDPGRMVVEGFKKLGFGATAAQLRDYIASLRGWPGVNGRYDFKTVPQRGLGPNSVIITRWDSEKQTWVGVSKPGGAPAR